MKKYKFNLLMFCIALTAIICSPVTAEESNTNGIKISPKTIEIGSFFNGDELTIEGDIESSNDIIIEVTGKNVDSSYDFKGKKGFLWMTKGNITLKNVPELYVMLLPYGKDWITKADHLGIGINKIKEKVITEGTTDVPANIFKMFSDLKVSEGLYNFIPESISYSVGKTGKKHFKTVCKLPGLIKEGSYKVKATIITPNLDTKIETASFNVEQVGFVKIVDNLASNRRILYGVSAVLIALGAGLIMGVFFRGGDSH